MGSLVMRIAVIGAAGQLGSELTTILSGAGHEVVGLDHAKIEVKEYDSVYRALSSAGAGVVINTSAYHRVDEVEENGLQAFAVNTIGPRNLALCCRELDVPLLHLSTDYVFSGDKGHPYLESDPVAPINLYGTSKAAGEMALRYLWRRHFIVRTGALFGKAGSSGKGGNFVELMIRLAREGKPIKVVNDQTMTPTSTVALAVQINAFIGTEAYGTYHATCQGQCTWYDFAAEIFRRADLCPALSPQSTAESGARARRPSYSVMENSNLKRLGLDLMPSWQEGLQAYLDERGETGSKGLSGNGNLEAVS
jgi:dTDP-4-dehydrorhamnose reductase